MKLLEYHKSFLENTVNLNQTRLDLLESRVESIYAAFAMDESFGPLVEDVLRQGSWAHRTIIKPLRDTEYDADVLLQIAEQPDWADNPKQYISQARGALVRSRDYSDKFQKKTRCLRVVYAGSCHVDVVPYVVLADGRQVIINSVMNAFEDANPKGFTDWMREKDGLAHGNLRKTIRLLKYIRDYKGTFSIPSVILTTLVGERIAAFDAETRYPDVPTALKTILADLDSWLQMYPNLPYIEDPSCPGASLNHRWDQGRYATFRAKIHDYSTWVTQAYDEKDKAASLALWQKVFGPSFQAPPVAKIAESAAAGASPVTPARPPKAPTEQFIEDMFPVQHRYNAVIDAKVLRRDGFRHGSLREMEFVGVSRKLRFTLRTDTPEPFDLYWKVRNFGSAAEAVPGGLRGQITKDSGFRTKTEPTAYRGQHYVDAYVVRNGVVVAMDRHLVAIR